jgi:hypothetical protein
MEFNALSWRVFSVANGLLTMRLNPFEIIAIEMPKDRNSAPGVTVAGP